jgi:hypothetical protein
MNKRFLGSGLTIFLLANSLTYAQEVCESCRQTDEAAAALQTMAPLVHRLDGTTSQAELLPVFYENFAVSCSVSQILSRENGAGGTGGHALIYIKGACRDTSVPYPKVRVCGPSESSRDRNAGVTLSIDKSLKNTLYVVTDGVDMMFNGLAQKGESINQEVIDKTAKAIVDSGAMKGVQIHDHIKRPEGVSDEEFAARHGMGTDFAISMARGSECVFTPLSKADVERMVNEANQRNLPYVTGKKINDWHGYGRNCAHFVNNVFASIGVGREIRVTSNPVIRALKLMTLFLPLRDKGVAIPRQIIANTGERLTASMPSPVEMIKDRGLRKKMKEFGSIPQRPGSVVGAVAFISDNELFDEAGKPMAVDILGRFDRKMKRLMTNPSTSTIEGNLESFIKRVDSMDLRPYEEAVSKHSQSPENKLLYESYRGLLVREREDAKLKLQVLRKEMTAEAYLALQQQQQ